MALAASPCRRSSPTMLASPSALINAVAKRLMRAKEEELRRAEA